MPYVLIHSGLFCDITSSLNKVYCAKTWGKDLGMHSMSHSLCFLGESSNYISHDSMEMHLLGECVVDSAVL